MFVDLGTEFDNKVFKQFLEERGVNRLEARSSITKAAVAERMIRTIKSRLYRLLLFVKL